MRTMPRYLIPQRPRFSLRHDKRWGEQGGRKREDYSLTSPPLLGEWAPRAGNVPYTSVLQCPEQCLAHRWTLTMLAMAEVNTSRTEKMPTAVLCARERTMLRDRCCRPLGNSCG